MKLLILIATILLVGCGTTAPVVPKFPEPPGKDATVRCPDLQKPKDGPVISEVSKTIVDNYGEYYVCAVKTDTWIKWYNEQKTIYDKIGK